MAEDGISEKFPDSWDLQYLWSVVVEYLSNDHPVDILIKRLVFYCYLHYFNILIWDKLFCVFTTMVHFYGFLLHFFLEWVTI